MTRRFDLTDVLSPGRNIGAVSDIVYAAYGRRPQSIGGRLILQDDLNPVPFLTLSRQMELAATSVKEVAERVSAFLSKEFDKGREPVKELHTSEGYGLLSELENIHLQTFFAEPRDLVRELETKLLPFMMKEFGATHVCVIRPNHRGQQSRLSLPKIFWAYQAFGASSLEEKIMKDRILDAILPDSHEILQWVEAFFTFSPAQIVLPISLMGGYVVFFASRFWIFPRASCAGILTEFTSTIGISTSDEDTMIQGVSFQSGSPDKIYGYVQMVVDLTNEISWYSTNPFNFIENNKFDGQRQLQFVSALDLLFSDVRSANMTTDIYARTSFCFSALDKMANLIAASSNAKLDEASVFKNCFSLRMINRLRALARKLHGATHSTVAKVLKKQLFFLVRVQKSVRGQVRRNSKEGDRLDWLWSYRNLRHGAFLRSNQFERLFIGAEGVVPSELARGLMALVLAMSVAPKAFFELFHSH